MTIILSVGTEVEIEQMSFEVTGIQQVEHRTRLGPSREAQTWDYLSAKWDDETTIVNLYALL